MSCLRHNISAVCSFVEMLQLCMFRLNKFNCSCQCGLLRSNETFSLYSQVVFKCLNLTFVQVKSYIFKIKYAAVYIAYFNSAINPILYGGFNENFRKGFRDAFHCFLWKKRNTVAPSKICFKNVNVFFSSLLI